MRDFETRRLPVERNEIAPDGSVVRILLGLQGGGMAHFELPAGQIANAVTHKTVDLLLFVEVEQLAECRTERSISYLISLDETLDIGTDAGTPAPTTTRRAATSSTAPSSGYKLIWNRMTTAI